MQVYFIDVYYVWHGKYFLGLFDEIDLSDYFQLQYYIDEEVKISEFKAILLHLARTPRISVRGPPIPNTYI